jgi:parallel beta-helix repeat protein
MKLFKIVTLSLFFVLNTILYGAYYVAPTGNDWGPGTFNEPWETIGKATGTLVAGDTVLIREGVYNETMHIRNSGNKENNIVFMAYDNETVVIDGGNNSSIIIYIPESYIEINNIKFQNVNSWGILIENCNHVKIQNCDIQDNLLSGIRVITSSNIELINNTFKNNAEGEDWGGGIWASAVDAINVTGNNITNTNAIAFGVLIDYSNNVIVENNYTYNTIHSGIFVTESNEVQVNDNEIVLALVIVMIFWFIIMKFIPVEMLRMVEKELLYQKEVTMGKCTITMCMI